MTKGQWDGCILRGRPRIVPIAPLRSSLPAPPIGKRQYGGGPYASPRPARLTDKANLARAPLRRATIAPAHGAPSTSRCRRFGVVPIWNFKHRTASACSVPAARAARPGLPARVGVVARVSAASGPCPGFRPAAAKRA
jgi:hypothetical protein